jgi:outer membrane protein assembly factor BamA
MRSVFALIFFLLSIPNCVHAQTDSTVVDSSTYHPKEDFSIIGFPLVFYLPETSLAFGGLGITVFNSGKKKAWRKSQIQLGLAYTLKKQFLAFLPFELYFKQNWKLDGELGYYRYFYNYFGIGATSNEKNLERYDANYPRLISTLSYRVNKSFLMGIRYRFDYFDIPFTDSLLTLDNPTGIEGGAISAIGTSFSFDNRDDIFYPSKGWNANLTTEFSSGFTLSDYTYALITLDVNYYQKIADKHILATNIYVGSSFGDLPFYAYYYLSSAKKGRGFNDRRFIDRNIGLLQIEYRFPIYKRLRGTTFTSLGTVSNKFGELFTNRQRWSFGGGLRFQLSKKQLNHIRLDIAGSNEGVQFYVTIGEAF